MDTENFQPDQFKALFAHANEGILVTQDTGEILLVNPAAAAMFGYGPQELVGQMVDVLIPESLRRGHVRHRENFRQNPHARSMGLGLELRGCRKDGSEFPVEVSLSPYQEGEGVFIIAFIIDVTIRQRLTAQREEMAVELEREKEISTLKTHFVSIASHEFRTPLSTILSSAALIGNYAERGDTASIKRHAERIKNSVQNLNTILGEFLSLGRIEDGKVEPRFEAVNLPELIHEVEEDMRAILKKGQTISYQHGGDDEAMLDKNLLRNVVINLLSNASKYSPEGAPVEVVCNVQNGRTELIVKDKGIGISEQDQQKLFSRFFRATNAGNVSGTGLGLYIVRRYVEMMGGSVQCQSQVGEGSEFRVEF